jgi:hypothetical protein
MKLIRKIVGTLWLMHVEVLASLFALYGYLITDNKLLLICVALSFAGAICGASIRVIDAVNKR